MSKKMDNVMVIVDFSAASMNASKTAIRMCQRHKARLHMLMIHDTEYLFPVAGMQAPALNPSQEIIAAEIDKLQTYAATVRQNYGIECIAHHELGWGISVVREIAKLVHCDMLLVANSYRRCRFLPDRGYDILKAVSCPVLILNDSIIDQFKNIVLPVRNAPNVLDKLPLTNLLARKNKAFVHIVGAFDKADSRGYARIKKMVNAAAQRLSINRVSNSYQIIYGKNVSNSILTACKDNSADLLVITACTLKSFRQMFYGNYVQRILNQSSIPVLCIKPETVADRKNPSFMFAHSL